MIGEKGEAKECGRGRGYFSLASTVTGRATCGVKAVSIAFGLLNECQVFPRVQSIKTSKIKSDYLSRESSTCSYGVG